MKEFVAEKYRIQLLTSRLIRMEYSHAGVFNDNKTVFAINRDFKDSFDISYYEDENTLEIDTEHIHFVYNKKEFSTEGLWVQLKSDISFYHSKWNYGKEHDTLPGTARTLDFTDGEIPLGKSIISRRGYALVDDSKNAIIGKNGIENNDTSDIDIYLFAYGWDYKQALYDFYKLSGRCPILPKYALGNWWSRYYEYTQDEYIKLMEEFERQNIPLSVAVIDMDWHITKVDKKYGSGWTGYTWNKELFPNHKEFLKQLHNKGLAVTLNLHPANGVRPYEERYEEFCKELNYTPDDKGIDFDCTSRKYLDAYFKVLHHPLEDEGVDFWWIDWQQGTEAKNGVDPLITLNHEHFKDLENRKRNALILSRYFGIGSHRYPLGFSGDAAISWKELDFQPYFTASASNVGYSWWSHDIGGHMLGIKDDELSLRWIQFGVFSPIMRLHSTKNEFNSKEPWLLAEPYSSIAKQFMRLRHMLMPYIYSEMVKSSFACIPFIRPMYYDNPDYEEAYEIKNQYYFGSKILLCPISKPMDKDFNLSEQKMWLADEKYYDIFKHISYNGIGFKYMYRGLDSIPTLAKSGSIIVMSKTMRADEQAESLNINIYSGKNGSYLLYENVANDMKSIKLYRKDEFLNYYLNGEKQPKEIEINCQSVQDDGNIMIPYSQDSNNIDELIKNTCSIINFEYKGDSIEISHINSKVRAYTIDIIGKRIEKASLGGESLEIEQFDSMSRIHLRKMHDKKFIKIDINEQTDIDINKLKLKQLYERLRNLNIAYTKKERIYNCLKKNNAEEKILDLMHISDNDTRILNSVLEIALQK